MGGVALLLLWAGRSFRAEQWVCAFLHPRSTQPWPCAPPALSRCALSWAARLFSWHTPGQTGRRGADEPFQFAFRKHNMGNEENERQSSAAESGDGVSRGRGTWSVKLVSTPPQTVSSLIVCPAALGVRLKDGKLFPFLRLRRAFGVCAIPEPYTF